MPEINTVLIIITFVISLVCVLIAILQSRKFNKETAAIELRRKDALDKIINLSKSYENKKWVINDTFKNKQR